MVTAIYCTLKYFFDIWKKFRLGCGAKNVVKKEQISLFLCECLCVHFLFTLLAILNMTDLLEVLPVHSEDTISARRGVFSESNGVIKAILEIKVFWLMSMISRLGPGSLLFQISIYALQSQSSYSWFTKARELPVIYDLPDPLFMIHIINN